VNHHAQWQSLRVVDPQTHEGRQCSLGGRAEHAGTVKRRTHSASPTGSGNVACTQVAPAVARLRALPPALWPEVHRLTAARGCTRRRRSEFSRTLRRCGHACALRSLQLIPPGERATHNPATRCVHGIVLIDASDLGPCQKGAQKNK